MNLTSKVFKESFSIFHICYQQEPINWDFNDLSNHIDWSLTMLLTFDPLQL